MIRTVGLFLSLSLRFSVGVSFSLFLCRSLSLTFSVALSLLIERRRFVVGVGGSEGNVKECRKERVEEEVSE